MDRRSGASSWQPERIVIAEGRGGGAWVFPVRTFHRTFHQTFPRGLGFSVRGSYVQTGLRHTYIVVAYMVVAYIVVAYVVVAYVVVAYIYSDRLCS